MKWECRTFANVTAKIQNSRNFHKRMDKTEPFNHNNLSQAEKGHRWTRDYCHVQPKATARPGLSSALSWRAGEHPKATRPGRPYASPTDRPAGGLFSF